MKVSKVNHTSTGVGAKNKRGEGILYKNPGEKGVDAKYEGDDLKARVDELNKKAKRLYSVFNEEIVVKGKKKSESDKKWEAVVSSFNIFMSCLNKKQRQNQLFFIRNFQNETITYKKGKDEITQKGRRLSLVEQIEKKTSDTPKTGMAALLANAGFNVNNNLYTNEDLENLIGEKVDKNIRRSYRVIPKGTKIKVKEVVKSLVYAIADQNAFDSVMRDLTDDELNAFLDVVDKDYNKQVQIERIVDSIKKQDTKIQINEKNGKTVLAPAFSYNAKKKPLFDFMIEYASNDERGREELRNEKKAFINEYLTAGNSDGTVFSETVENKLSKVSGEIDKNVKRELLAEIDELIRHELVAKFQDVRDSLDENDLQGRYWLTFFANEAENWLRDSVKKSSHGLSKSGGNRRLLNEDLFNHLYKYFLSFLASKYVDMGKGVYHFTSFSGKNIGEILPEFSDGISSFDYERIAAEEKVKRDMSTYVAFAVNNFATSVCTTSVLSKNDDALSISPKEKPELFRDNAKKRILRYFGGESAWDSLDNVTNEDFIFTFRENLAAVRNSTIHFDADFKTGRTQNVSDLIVKMFQEEYSRISNVYAQKYYSNNVPMFYSISDISNLVGKALYRTDRPVVAAVPSFGRIVPRSKVSEFLDSWLGRDRVYKINGMNVEMLEKLKSSLYFTLKEIYYYGFLAENDMMSYLDRALIKIEPQVSSEKDSFKKKKAYDDFKRRYDEIKKSGDVSASEICERIMIDFSLQNNDIKEVKTSKNGSSKMFEREVYEHFRMLLYKLLRSAFLDYINSNKSFAFLKNPENKTAVIDRLTVEEFSAQLKVDAYSSAKEAIANPELLAWYATAHFMSKKQINLLCGSIRTELKYLKDIDRRAESTKNSLGKNTDAKIEFYKKLLRVLEFTMNFCDQISNKVLDYFEDENDYAEKLHVFVDYPKMKFAKDSLIAFCNNEIEGSRNGKIGIYYDAENPIANKNVIRADMYGYDNLFASGIVRKVSYDDIKEYYSLVPKVDKIFFENGERTEKEQRLIRRYQNLKNRIELTDIVSYSELINDLYGQLLSWIYLRERDLVYMQLGFHYISLIWGDCVSENDPRNKYVEGNKFDFESGAILYFIKAMYSHDMELPEALTTKKGSIVSFFAYYGEETYNSGLELFERIENHEEAINLRNYIAHFKYFSRLNHSMEEIYGDIFSSFFSYNTNLHKSIPVVYRNILAQYKLLASIEITESDSKTYSEKTVRDYKNVKWVIKEDYSIYAHGFEKTIKGLESDKLTFKIKKEAPTERNRHPKGEVDLEAHDDKYLDNVRRLLSYKK